MNYRTFPSQALFYQYIKTVADDFDYGKSCYLPPYSFLLKDGTYYGCAGLPHMLATLNHLFGTKFDPMKSVTAYPTTIIFETEKPYTSETLVIKGIQTRQVKIAGLDVVKTQRAVEDKVSEIDVPYQAQPDWDYVQELRDREPKGDKSALDEYAKEFEIELNGRKSFDNMVKDFKAAVGE